MSKFSCNALKAGDEKTKEDAHYIKQLYETKWKQKVSSQALKDMKNKKMNKMVKICKSADSDIEDETPEVELNEQVAIKLKCAYHILKEHAKF